MSTLDPFDSQARTKGIPLAGSLALIVKRIRGDLRALGQASLLVARILVDCHVAGRARGVADMLVILSNDRTWPAIVCQVAPAVISAQWDRVLRHCIFSVIVGLADDSPALVLGLRGLSLVSCPVRVLLIFDVDRQLRLLMLSICKLRSHLLVQLLTLLGRGLHALCIRILVLPRAMHARLRVSGAANKAGAGGHASFVVVPEAVLLLAVRATTALGDLVFRVRVAVRL